jgi:hypothetical protein
VPDPNRVTPEGGIAAIAQRGLFMGNRGCLHRGDERAIARPWQVRRWITCALEHKGWVAPMWQPGRWTPLFFWDEAVALAAGHRPCALCRRAAYTAWLDAWEAAFGGRPRAEEMDHRLHHDRRAGRTQRRHAAPWPSLPAGTFVSVAGGPALVLDDRLVPWSAGGYGPPLDRPARGGATVLTPRATVAVIGHGFPPVLHPAAGATR